jgi:hypothetical protein
VKIVHQIYRLCSMSGSVRRYRQPANEEDGYADIMITAPSGLEGHPDEIVYFEGTAKVLIAAFRDAADLLESELKLQRPMDSVQ